MNLLVVNDVGRNLFEQTNKQTNRDSKRYRGKAEGRQCRIAMSCALSI